MNTAMSKVRFVPVLLLIIGFLWLFQPILVKNVAAEGDDPEPPKQALITVNGVTSWFAEGDIIATGTRTERGYCDVPSYTVYGSVDIIANENCELVVRNIRTEGEGGPPIPPSTEGEQQAPTPILLDTSNTDGVVIVEDDLSPAKQVFVTVNGDKSLFAVGDSVATGTKTAQGHCAVPSYTVWLEGSSTDDYTYSRADIMVNENCELVVSKILKDEQ